MTRPRARARPPVPSPIAVVGVVGDHTVRTVRVPMYVITRGPDYCSTACPGLDRKSASCNYFDVALSREGMLGIRRHAKCRKADIENE